MSLIEVSFPGGLRVDADMKGRTIATDQPIYAGGENSAPALFELFLASLATCAGIFALSFCQNKGISTDGMSLSLDLSKNPESKAIDEISIGLKLPDGFPEKYKDAIVRAMDQCSVKKLIHNPPVFKVSAE